MSKEQYKDANWLYKQYVELGKLQLEISEECGVGRQCIGRFLRKYGISRKDQFLRRSQKIAASRGGILISTEYINNYSKLLWRCSEGHEWEADFNAVSGGTWCPECVRVSISHTLQHAINLGISKGGRCLSKEYINSKTKMLWECAEGHRWEADFNAVSGGTWCPICASVQSGLKKRLSLQDVISSAKDRGLTFLENEYRGSHIKHLYRCSSGHVFEMRPSNVNAGIGCPRCSRKPLIKENKFRDALEATLGYKFPSIRPEWLINPVTGHRLEIDGYNEELKLGFERSGRQHFEYVEFFHRTYANFESQQGRDRHKARILSERGIFMLYPTYKLKEEDFHKFIVDAIRREPQRDGRGHKIR